VEVRALGPVALADGGAVLEVNVGKHRALLAMLALRDGDLVSTSELIDAVWGDDPPATATKTLQGYVSSLRHAFGRDLIETVPGGYRFGPAVDEIDVIEFERAIESGRHLLEQRQPRAARRAFAAALDRWRGPPLDDLADGGVRTGQSARLHELHLLAVDGWIEAELDLGHHREVVPDLERLVAEYPYRESLWRALMLALYRSGRAAAALHAYKGLRAELVEEFGLEPSNDTRELEHRILDQDPVLDLPVDAAPTNLPPSLDSFVDRVAERQSLISLLHANRFVTVVGVGGVGKSRLATEVGRALLVDMPGGVWWIDLARETGDIPLVPVVTSALGLGVSPSGSPERVLVTRLRQAPTLLILDNCEHLATATTSFVEWVTMQVPSVRVLATSREALRMRGVRQMVLEPLRINEGDHDEISNAGRLFLDRIAERVDASPPDTAAAETVAGLVGGLPLGIELAAAQCVAITPHDLARRLRDPDALLSMTDWASNEERHANLRQVLASGLDSIAPELATRLSLLTVFTGDFELDAASAVLDVPRVETERTVTVLLGASLLSRSPTDAPHRRFRLLWPIRELLSGLVGDADRRNARVRHAHHFKALALSFLRAIDTPSEPERIELVSVDRHNHLAALRWFERNDPAGALVFGPALGLERQLRGGQREACDLLHRLLDEAAAAPEAHLAWAEASLTWPELLSGDIVAALAHNENAVMRFEALDDQRGLGFTLRSRAHALHLRGADEATTTPIYQRSIDAARAARLPYAVALGQVEFAHSLTVSERFDVVDVESMLTDAELILAESHDHANLAHSALSRAFIAFSNGDTAALRIAAEQMLRESRLGHVTMWEQTAMAVLGIAAYEADELDEARSWFHEAIHLGRDTDNRYQLGITLHAFAAVFAESSPEVAARILGIAGTLAPTWPLLDRRYGEWIGVAREALGAHFDELAAQGAQLELDDAVALTDSVT
jgi:DNA-binding SARP family transcriptional activator/predicted ATPase